MAKCGEALQAWLLVNALKCDGLLAALVAKSNIPIKAKIKCGEAFSEPIGLLCAMVARP